MATPLSDNPAKVGHNLFLKMVNHLSHVCGVVASAMIVVAVIVTCQMLWVRFVLNDSTIWQTEAVTYLVISATLLGLPYVQHLRGHVNVNLLPMLLPAKFRKAFAIFTLLLTLAIVTIIAFYGYEMWYMAWDGGWKSDTVWGVSLYIPYLAMPVGFALYGLQLVADIYALIANIDQPFGLEGDA